MVLVIGHRGASGLEPENTIRSFARAFEMGCGMVELDVRLTSDGEPVVMHDEYVDRTTDGSGRVSDMELREVRGLDAGMGEKVPTLMEVLVSFSGRSIDIELKGEDTAYPVYGLLKDLAGRGIVRSSDLMVSSFSPVTLKEFSDAGSDVPLAVLVDRDPEGSQEFAELIGARAVNPNHDHLDEDFVERCGRMGLDVNTWTVNDPADARKYALWGVNGIFTDRPDMIIERINRMGRGDHT